MTTIFKALDDETRRLILDELAARDGQSLFELCARLAMRHEISSSRQAISQHLAVLEEWMRSYRPEEIFDLDGRPTTTEHDPTGPLRMSASPWANAGLLTQDLLLRDLSRYAVEVTSPGPWQGRGGEVELVGAVRCQVRVGDELVSLPLEAVRVAPSTAARGSRVSW